MLVYSASANAQTKLTVKFLGDQPVSSHQFPVDASTTWDATTVQRFAGTSGDCKGVDVSKIKDSVVVGKTVSVTPGWINGSQSTFRIEYTNVKFNGTKPVEFRPGCIVNNLHTSAISFTQYLVVQPGIPSEPVGVDAERIVVSIE